MADKNQETVEIIIEQTRVIIHKNRDETFSERGHHTMPLTPIEPPPDKKKDK